MNEALGIRQESVAKQARETLRFALMAMALGAFCSSAVDVLAGVPASPWPGVVGAIAGLCFAANVARSAL